MHNSDYLEASQLEEKSLLFFPGNTKIMTTEGRLLLSRKQDMYFSQVYSLAYNTY